MNAFPMESIRAALSGRVTIRMRIIPAEMDQRALLVTDVQFPQVRATVWPNGDDPACFLTNYGRFSVVACMIRAHEARVYSGATGPFLVAPIWPVAQTAAGSRAHAWRLAALVESIATEPDTTTDNALTVRDAVTAYARLRSIADHDDGRDILQEYMPNRTQRLELDELLDSVQVSGLFDLLLSARRRAQARLLYARADYSGPWFDLEPRRAEFYRAASGDAFALFRYVNEFVPMALRVWGIADEEEEGANGADDFGDLDSVFGAPSRIWPTVEPVPVTWCDAIDQTETCAVCLEDGSECRLSKLETCGHLFHQSCIRTLQMRAMMGDPTRCPLCRADQNTGQPGANSCENCHAVGRGGPLYTLGGSCGASCGAVYCFDCLPDVSDCCRRCGAECAH
jgi:hypothetical protein